MTTGPIRARNRTTLFIAFNIMVLLGAYLIVIQPILFILNEQVARLNERSAELARYRAFSGQEPEIYRLYQDTNETSSAKMFLSGGSDGASGALLQGRLKQTGGIAGLQILSLASLDPYTENGVHYLGARMEVSGPIEGIHNTLRDIESGGAPILFVKSMTIRAPLTEADTINQVPILDAEFEIYGATGYVNAAQ